MTRPRFSAVLAGEMRTTEEIREAVFLSTGDARAKQSRFWLLLVLAAGIATAGIVSDSTPTVIGAMIIAPLATPTQGIALAIVFGELHALVRSAVTLVGAVIATVAIGGALAWILPQLEPLSHNTQVAARAAQPWWTWWRPR